MIVLGRETRKQFYLLPPSMFPHSKSSIIDTIFSSGVHPQSIVVKTTGCSDALTNVLKEDIVAHGDVFRKL